MSLPDALATAQPTGPRSPLAALTNWFERHAQTFVASLGRLVRQPFASLLTTAVIGLGLALPVCLHLVVVNARTVTAGIENSVQVSVYLRQPMSAEAAAKVLKSIAARGDVLEARLVSPAEGLREFEGVSGFGEALKALTDNPLPYAVVVRPAPRFDTPEAVETLTAELQTLPEVDLVQVDTEWVRRFHAILDALRRAVWLAAGLLGLGVLAIVGNTIRLDINGRREEIEVTKLIGGSNAFVRRPFLYGGVWYGLGGGLLAWLLVTLALALLADPVGRVAALYGSSFRLQGLSAREILLLVGSGTALGWIGSWVTAAYHLRRIEPRA